MIRFEGNGNAVGLPVLYGLRASLNVYKNEPTAWTKKKRKEGDVKRSKGASKGCLTQQEMSAKAGVRQGASGCFVCVRVSVCVVETLEIVATCQIQ